MSVAGEPEGKRNKCSHCSAQFKKACHLYRHERDVHNVQPVNRRSKIIYIEGTDHYVVAGDKVSGASGFCCNKAF